MCPPTIRKRNCVPFHEGGRTVREGLRPCFPRGTVFSHLEGEGLYPPIAKGEAVSSHSEEEGLYPPTVKGMGRGTVSSHGEFWGTVSSHGEVGGLYPPTGTVSFPR